ncbi:hypothetical protein [Halochromatium salexigens]|uniref:hypothetical protein n=1 Tax=Halochromatium salexigens TaxID=49447 RepID=UPI001911EBF5|nr:hypothetical protein [Halochromatium salexigens]
MRSIADNQRPDAVCLPAQQAEVILQPYWTLTLKTGLKVNVPADLDNPVTLTLLELEDWPEPKVAFLCAPIQVLARNG